MKLTAMICLLMSTSMLTTAYAKTADEVKEALVDQIIKEYNLVPAECGEEAEDIVVKIEEADSSGHDDSSLKPRPYVGLSVGSMSIGFVNPTAGLENKYAALDVQLGAGLPKYDGSPDSYKTMSSYSSIALRAKIGEYFEVGVRGMDRSYDKAVSEEYINSQRNIGYDVRVMVYKSNDGIVSSYLNFSGLKKGTLVPNFLQLGLKFNLGKN